VENLAATHNHAGLGLLSHHRADPLLYLQRCQEMYSVGSGSLAELPTLQPTIIPKLSENGSNYNTTRIYENSHYTTVNVNALGRNANVPSRISGLSQANCTYKMYRFPAKAPFYSSKAVLQIDCGRRIRGEAREAQGSRRCYVCHPHTPAHMKLHGALMSR
jgi:hypothetical protein